MRGNERKSSSGCGTLICVALLFITIYFLLYHGHDSTTFVQHLFSNSSVMTTTSSTTGGFSLPDLLKGVHLPSLSGAPALSAMCAAYANDYSSANAKKYAPEACQDALDAGIPPRTFVRQINQESGFDPSSGSSAGAKGIAQFMPATAAGMSVDANDPHAALKGGARLMAGYLHNYGGDMAKSLAAYNCGSGCVESAASRYGAAWLAHTPAETRHYVATIMG